MNKDFFINNIDDYNEACKEELHSLRALLINPGLTIKDLMYAIKITHEIVTDCFEMNMKYGEENENE